MESYLFRTVGFNLQISFTPYRRDDPLEPERERPWISTFSTISFGAHRQDIVWGLGYRYTTDRIGGSLTVSFDPPNRALQLFDSFVQDEIALVQNGSI